MNFKEISPKELSGNVFKMIDDDWTLVTAEKDGKVNTMTASWGGLGILWNKPVAFVFIRPQRYTYEFTEESPFMTLSFFGGNEREALKLCGTKSGRDCDKINEAGLTVKEVDGMYSFEESEVILECRKIYTDMIEKDLMIEPDIMKCYPKNDFHRMYICEVTKVLIKE